MNTIKSIYFHTPTPPQLERTLRWMKRGGYRFLSADELYQCLTSGHMPQGRLAFLSLDDAWRSNLQLIPVIEKYGAPITIFAPTEPIEAGNYWWEYIPREERECVKRLSYADFCRRVANERKKLTMERSCMTEEEIRTLARHPLVSIQSHTMTHPILTALPDELLKEEMRQSKRLLEAITGEDVSYFSYPNGSYTTREVEAARQVYKMALTTDLRDIHLDDDVLALPRIELTGRRYRDILKFYNIWPFLRKMGCILLRRPQE